MSVDIVGAAVLVYSVDGAAVVEVTESDEVGDYVVVTP